MTELATKKVCCCCGTAVGLKKRVCPVCKVPAIWRAETIEETTTRTEKHARLQTLLNNLTK